jgi:hypothetical protein
MELNPRAYELAAQEWTELVRAIGTERLDAQDVNDACVCQSFHPGNLHGACSE